MSFLARLRRRLWPAPLPVLGSVDAYAQWAASYPPYAHNALMQTEEAAMTTLLPTLDGLSVLDLACGSGRYGLIAQSRRARQVLELDNSPAMLAVNSLPLRALATSEALPLAAESLDGVICGLALGHVPRLEPSLREIARVLRPGGWALVSDFHPYLFLSGARRTFTSADGRVYAVEHYPHLMADYFRAALVAGLRLDALVEPPLNTPTAPTDTPVVFVFRLRREPAVPD